MDRMWEIAWELFLEPTDRQTRYEAQEDLVVQDFHLFI